MRKFVGLSLAGWMALLIGGCEQASFIDPGEVAVVRHPAGMAIVGAVAAKTATPAESAAGATPALAAADIRADQPATKPQPGEARIVIYSAAFGVVVANVP